jgi:uncharacterized membrane protein YfcA
MLLDNTIYKFVIVCFIGLFSGILQGSLGSVGVIVIIPALLLTRIVGDFKTACGTILITFLFPTSLLGLYEYYKSNSIALLTGIVLTIMMTIGGYFGSLVSKYISFSNLELISGIIFIIIGLYYLFIGTNSLYVKNIHNKTILF